MDHNNAVTLLEETFDNEFVSERYKKLINEIFNHFKFNIRPVYPKKEYYDYVSNVMSFGVYRDPNKHSIEVFSVELKRTNSRDRARTMQRNLIAGLLKNFKRQAALVAFYGNDQEDWRFSFVKMEYKFEGEKGNWKVIEQFSPAKRYSFLVGKNESNHTCKMQFLGLIKQEESDPLLEQIEEKFSIEKVTKDFFDDYKDLYLDLKESLEVSIQNDEIILQEFEDKIIKTSDFAKKLMGQIVFIYFLQKKGWLGVKKGKQWRSGPKKFLEKLFNKKYVDYDNFFNDVLEPLFYDALSSKHDNDYYEKFKCRIPFLNGGLFEPINNYNWETTNIKLKNKTFADIFNTFDRYNFTVKEDEPLEKEVAVDPEMLGKVFENLLDVEDRKSKGAFYTPREIVHYMCQESLINYLNVNSEVDKNDIENFIHHGDIALGSIIKQQEELKKYGRTYEKNVLSDSIKINHQELDKLLRDVKVVDPAVGSGAFPVGMMNEIIRARTILSLYSGKNVTNYELKLETIENSLYGVDIDSSAVDIAKLRFWLSLIVDEEDVVNIEPLPNLDHKIMCGNSLLEEFEGKILFDDNLLKQLPEDQSKKIGDIQKQIDELHRELGEIFTGKNPNEIRKDEIQHEIKKLKREIKNLKKSSKDQYDQFTLDQDFNKRVKASQLKFKELKKLQKNFFNEQNGILKKKYRDEIDKIEWDFIEETLNEQGDEEAILKLSEYKKNKSKPFFLWKLYFSEIFRRENPGFDIVIANPPYAVDFDDDEKRILEEKYPSIPDYESSNYFIAKSLELLRNNGFKSFITINTFLMNIFARNFRLELLNKWNFVFINNLSMFDVFESAKVRNCITLFQKGNKDFTVTFANFKEDYGIINKTNLNKDYLIQNIDNWLTIFTQDNKIISIINKIKNNSQELNTLADVSQGLIPYDKYRGHSEETIKNRIWHSSYKKDDTYKKELKGRDVGKYSLKWNGKTWISYGDWLAAPRKKEFFTNERIILREITNPSILATYTKEEYYNTPSIINIINFQKVDPLYLLGVMNSKLLSFYHFETSPKAKKGLFPKILVNDVRRLPIKLIFIERQNKIIELVKNVLNLADSDNLKNPQIEMKYQKLLNEIDILVYEIYGLTSEEINLVKNFQFIKDKS